MRRWHVVPREPEIERGIEWHPNLVILDVRSLDLTAGSALIGQLHRMDLQVCVIDEADDVDRLNAWMAAGTSALIDGGEPLDQLLRTINRLLRSGSLQQTAQKSSASMALTHAAERPQDTRLPHFADLTERERGRPGRADGRPLRGRNRTRRIRLNLHCSLTDQGDTPEARRQLPVGCRCARPAGRVVPRQPRRELSQAFEQPAHARRLTSPGQTDRHESDLGNQARSPHVGGPSSPSEVHSLLAGRCYPLPRGLACDERLHAGQISPDRRSGGVYLLGAHSLVLGMAPSRYRSSAAPVPFTA